MSTADSDSRETSGPFTVVYYDRFINKNEGGNEENTLASTLPYINHFTR